MRLPTTHTVLDSLLHAETACPRNRAFNPHRTDFFSWTAAEREVEIDDRFLVRYFPFASRVYMTVGGGTEQTLKCKACFCKRLTFIGSRVKICLERHAPRLARFSRDISWAKGHGHLVLARSSSLLFSYNSARSCVVDIRPASGSGRALVLRAPDTDREAERRQHRPVRPLPVRHRRRS